MSVLLNSLFFVSSIVNTCEEIILAQQWAILTASGIASFSCKVVAKAVVRGARRGATKPAKARVRLNNAEKRKELTLEYQVKAKANKAKDAEKASNGSVLSEATKAARAAQSSAQKAANAVRKLENMINGKKTYTKKVKTITTGIISVKADNASISQRDSWHKLTHKVSGKGTKNANITAEFKTFAKVKEEKQKDLSIAKAKKAAMRQKWIELRREKIARICANAWMKKGIWVDSFLAEACNDSDYAIREQSYRELLALVGEAA